MFEKYPDSELKTYVVWYNMIPGDSKKRWNDKLITDSSAKHFWDEEKNVGNWIGKHVKTCKHLGDTAWDAYFLFGEDAIWEGDTLGPIEGCGTPIIANPDQFTKDLKALLTD